MDLHVRVWYGNAGSPKEFSKEQTVILLFDPEEPAPVCLLAGGSRHTAQGSLEPWDYATEIGPRAHDGNSYVWMAPSGPKLIRCILGFTEFMCLLSGLKGCVGLGPEWIIHLNGAAAINRAMSVPGFTSKLVEPWAVCHNPFRVARRLNVCHARTVHQIHSKP